MRLYIFLIFSVLVLTVSCQTLIVDSTFFDSTFIEYRKESDVATTDQVIERNVQERIGSSRDNGSVSNGEQYQRSIEVERNKISTINGNMP